MRFVFLGGGRIAGACLRTYVNGIWGGIRLGGAVVAPDLLPLVESCPGNPLAAAINHVDRDESVLRCVIEASRPDFVISVQYPWILSAELLDVVGGAVLNLHNAKLPDYRGHNTISHEILNGESLHTCTLHWVAAEVDRGAVAMTVEVPIWPDDTAYRLWCRSSMACAGLFRDFLTSCGAIVPGRLGTAVGPGGRYFSKRGLEAFKEIPPSAPPRDVDRIARAFWFPPHEPAYMRHGERKLYVLPGSYDYVISNELRECVE